MTSFAAASSDAIGAVGRTRERGATMRSESLRALNSALKKEPGQPVSRLCAMRARIDQQGDGGGKYAHTKNSKIRAVIRRFISPRQRVWGGIKENVCVAIKKGTSESRKVSLHSDRVVEMPCAAMVCNFGGV